jgi:hypothetical protein
MRFWSAIVAVMLASSFSLVASAQSPHSGTQATGKYPIFINGHRFYARPTQLRRGRVLAAIVRAGKVLVPLKSMFEQLGGTVQYDPVTRSTMVRSGQTIVEVTVGSPQVRIDGDILPLDVAPIVYRGAILIPVRVIAEALGAYVEYQPRLHAVVIRRNAALAKASPPRSPAVVSAPSHAPISAAPRATVPPGPPIPVQPPSPETYVVADIAVSPHVANAYAPKVAGRTGESFDVRGASEFAILDLPLEFDGEYTRYAYAHPAGRVTAIGGAASSFVSKFDAHDSDLSFQLGAQLNPEKFYFDASYVRLDNSYRYPSVGGFGLGLQKLPVLERRFSYEASVFYYPNVSGACNTAACSPGAGTLSYALLRYSAGLTYARGPVFVEVGYRGDSARAKAAPVGFTHAGAFVGIGGRF